MKKWLNKLNRVKWVFGGPQHDFFFRQIWTRVYDLFGTSDKTKNFYNDIISIYSTGTTEWLLKNHGTLIKQNGGKVEQINLKTGRTYFSITGSPDEDLIYD